MRSAKKWPNTLSRATLYLGLAGVLAVTGCGDGKIARYPVSGSVQVDGRPAEGAIVVFCPVDAGAELKDLRPSGLADAQGVFQLMTIQPSDGAPAGKYKIIVKWPAPPRPGAEDRDGRGPKPGPDRLKGKYYDLDRSPLTATVEKKSNQLAPFELTTK
jgi:hypothetical protein